MSKRIAITYGNTPDGEMATAYVEGLELLTTGRVMARGRTELETIKEAVEVCLHKYERLRFGPTWPREIDSLARNHII